jgi:hypothetical protein
MMKLNKLALITGSDILFEDQFFIHSPTIEELSLNNITEDELFKTLKLLTVCKEDLQNEQQFIDKEINNFQLLLAILCNEKYPETDKIMFFKILELLLNNYIVSFSGLGFILNDKNNSESFFFLNEENFDLFQNYIKEIFCFSKIFSSEQSKEEYNVVGERAKKIAEQLKKRHEKLAAKNKSKTNENACILANYMSILAIGIPCDLNSLVNKTVYQIFNLLDRYSLYYNYDLDVRCKLAGSTEETEVENWMKIQ